MLNIVKATDLHPDDSGKLRAYSEQRRTSALVIPALIAYTTCGAQLILKNQCDGSSAYVPMSRTDSVGSVDIGMFRFFVCCNFQQFYSPFGQCKLLRPSL